MNTVRALILSMFLALVLLCLWAYAVGIGFFTGDKTL